LQTFNFLPVRATFRVINVKKLASLQHCVRVMTAAAVFAQLKQQISQNMILLVQHIAKKVTVLRRNIIFCDICCFSCSNIAAAVIALTQCCKLASFFTFIFAVFVCFCAVHLSHKFCRCGNAWGSFWEFFYCTCAETTTFLLPVKSLMSPLFPPTPISYKRHEISAL